MEFKGLIESRKANMTEAPSIAINVRHVKKPLTYGRPKVFRYNIIIRLQTLWRDPSFLALRTDGFEHVCYYSEH